MYLVVKVFLLLFYELSIMCWLCLFFSLNFCWSKQLQVAFGVRGIKQNEKPPTPIWPRILHHSKGAQGHKAKHEHHEQDPTNDQHGLGKETFELSS